MEFTEYVRVFNIGVASLAFILNMIKGWQLKLHRHMNADASMGFVAVMAWCLCYAVAATIGAYEGVHTGTWTIIMGAPCIWTLAAGFMGWKVKYEDDHATMLKTGALSVNEIRERHKRLYE